MDSPVGKALLGKKVGALARFETPRGPREFKILKITA